MTRMTPSSQSLATARPGANQPQRDQEIDHRDGDATDILEGSLRPLAMVSPSPTARSSPPVTELAPSYRIPLALVGLAVPLAVVNPWLGGIVGLFGVFLGIQAITLRLQFTNTALDIYRGEKQIRQFPYAEWEHWEIFWSPVPILFYFREVKSIHFLPIIFSPSQLRTALDAHCSLPLKQD